MRAFSLAVSATAVSFFGALAAAQDYPEITAPALLPIGENQTELFTPPLPPDDEDYVDESVAARLAKRSPPAGAYICDAINWKGTCKTYPVSPYVCQNYPATGSSSIGPPQGWQCKLFYGPNCQLGTGTDGKLTYPGIPNVATTYNKAGAPTSFMCRECSDVPGGSPCVNNNAPDFYFAQAKYGYGGVKDFQDKPTEQAKTNSSRSRRPATPKTKDAKSTLKRKQPDDEEKSQKPSKPAKKQKQTSIKADEDLAPSEDSKPVIINRAPVLQLWAACISQKLYPKLSWDTHLSIGSAISALCAVSKGRAIGKIDQADPDKKAKKDKKKRAAEQAAEDEVEVMGFRLLLKDGSAIVSGKPQKANEELLIKKYGEEDYERVKKTMEEAIDSFEGKAKKGELSRTAFHMYEKIRPTVQHGQGGWGKKGELKLESIRELADR
ncbi:hypothetical protein H2200_003165 [Cladophialophora chaetospira]|uniref:Uncharacterized protein n=1 Tax=Cladophialophora chaetospira TaxID=386627 RepID=A0AA38XGT9_9EURO|nr:hypothetical protein H2200_003165 [Cladophialophora chaetospira]